MALAVQGLMQGFMQINKPYMRQVFAASVKGGDHRDGLSFGKQ